MMSDHLSDVQEKQQLFLDSEMCASLVQEFSNVTVRTILKHESKIILISRPHPVYEDYPGISREDETGVVM